MTASRKPTPEADMGDPDTFEMLADLVRRIEADEEEKASIAEGIRDIYHEAKRAGFNTKVLRKVITKRRQDPNALRAIEEEIELYETTLERAGTNRSARKDKKQDLLKAVE